ncbi:TetR/AcrR family transcriptional regulator [Amycolatopsis thermoflava]|uniref:TetR/AcrR family transcriptional regulator n=1 Tax=Amycolatopsis thermoflava TaxID=84480 RepID=UPI00380E04DD
MTRPAGAWREYGPLELTPILAAALEAFYEQGFHGTPVRDIARRVGQTVPALYYHHENKEGVFTALVEEATSDLDWRVRQAVEEAGERPDLRLVNAVEAIVLHMAHRTRLAALDFELRHLSPANRKRYAARRKEIEVLVTRIVSAGVAEGLFVAKRPAETARALLGMLQSIGRWYHPDGGPLSPDELAERYVDIALMTVGVRKRPAARARRKARSA